MAKGFVRENISLCLVLVRLVLKKDGAFCMSMDTKAITKITIKYRYPIPILDDMLDELYGSSIFSKVNLRNGFH